MEPSTPIPGSNYRPAPLASLPETLDVNYYQWSPERKCAEAERLAIRARLKHEYLRKLNDPQRTGLIEDPALVRWNYARSYNITSNCRATPKTALLGLIFTAGPILFWSLVLKARRDRRETLIKEGKYERTIPVCY